MIYTKKPLLVDEQIDCLRQRGLNFSNRNLAKNYLQNISYYRLQAYTYPFQDNDPDADHEFLEDDIDFSDIIDLYVFDRRLRSLVFNELEKIEVAIRTKLSLIYSNKSQDPFWYLEKGWFSRASQIDFPFLTKDGLNIIKQNKLFAILSALKYVVDIISPGNSFKQNLMVMLNDHHRLLKLKEMGFPKDWQNQPVWKI